jgi:CubicO group peptidase (beta-lactamase class C family)
LEPLDLPRELTTLSLFKLTKMDRVGMRDLRHAGCLVLLLQKEGKIVFERYSSGLTRDNNYELYSITKAMTAMLGRQTHRRRKDQPGQLG